MTACDFLLLLLLIFIKCKYLNFKDISIVAKLYNFPKELCLLFSWQELEEERSRLIYDVTTNKRRMKELEENLLYKLTSIQVCISPALLWRKYHDIIEISCKQKLMKWRSHLVLTWEWEDLGKIPQIPKALIVFIIFTWRFKMYLSSGVSILQGSSFSVDPQNP